MISKKEAEFARKHPKLQTAKNVLGAAHEAGMQGAVIGAVVGGSISLISNIVAVIKGEKDGKQAAKDFEDDAKIILQSWEAFRTMLLGADDDAQTLSDTTAPDLDALLCELLKTESVRDAAAIAAERLKLPKKQVYQRALELKQ